MTLAFAMVTIGSAIAIGSIALLGFGRRETGAGHHAESEPSEDRANEESELRPSEENGEVAADEKHRDGSHEPVASPTGLNFRLITLASHRRLLSAVAMFGIAVAGIAGFFELNARADQNGAPTSPVRSQAFQEPGTSGNSDYANLLAYANGQSRKVPVTMSPWNTKRKTVPDVDTMITRLAARLEKSPNDADGWRMLGWSYFNTQKYQLAADAYVRAVGLRDDSAPYQSAFGEALVKAAGDVVTPKAKAAFDKALSIDASNTLSRFYAGLAKQQGGDAKGALEDWIPLARDASTDEKLRLGLKKRILALAKQIGEDVSSRLPADTKIAEPEQTKSLKSPTDEDMRNARAMSEAERTAMIRGMVDGLADRLTESPRDPEGWIRLIRSRQVLKESEKARAALRRAYQIFSDSPATQKRIAAEAKALGVTTDR